MGETLSQAEIDALRAAVKSGEALEEGEVEAPVGPAQMRVVDYDFRKPHIVASDQYHALQMMHEAAGKAFQAGMLTAMKSGVEIKLVAVDQISYGEFVLSLSTPTYLVALATKPNIGTIAMQIELPIVMTVTDILLGGNGHGVPDPRELTVLETNIFGGITRALLKDLSEAWATMTEVAFDITAVEANPEYMQVTTPETPCLNMLYDVRLGDVTGMMNLCYPFDVIQAALAAAEKRSGARRAGGDGGDAMLRAMEVVPLNLRVVVAGGRMPAHALVQLAPGDVICLDRRCDRAMEIRIGDTPVFQGGAGRYKGKIAVMLQ